MQVNLTKWFNFFFVSSLIWLLLEGIFRKWLLPSLTVQLFAGKYILFSITYLLYFYNNPKIKKPKYLFQFFFIVFSLWCIIQIVNPKMKPPILVTIFGYLNHLFFIPIFFITPYYFKTLKSVDKLFRILAYISIPIFILGIIQYTLPMDHFLNKLANDEQGAARISTYMRANSIFTFVKNFNSYLLFTIPMFISYIFYRLELRKSVFLYVILIFLGIVNSFITASRLPIFLLGTFLILQIIYIYFRISRLRKTILILSIISTMLGTVFYTTNETFQLSVNNFIYRVNLVEHFAEQGVEGYSAKDRIIDRLTIFKFSEEAGLIGFGIGTTYQGTGFYLNKKRPDIKFEEEGERVVLELGVIGGVIAILFRLSIFLYALSLLLKSSNVYIKLFQIFLIFQLIPPLFFLNNITVSYIDAALYWFSFGLVISLNKIESSST